MLPLLVTVAVVGVSAAVGRAFSRAAAESTRAHGEELVAVAASLRAAGFAVRVRRTATNLEAAWRDDDIPREVVGAFGQRVTVHVDRPRHSRRIHVELEVEAVRFAVDARFAVRRRRRARALPSDQVGSVLAGVRTTGSPHDVVQEALSGPNVRGALQRLVMHPSLRDLRFVPSRGGVGRLQCALRFDDTALVGIAPIAAALEALAVALDARFDGPDDDVPFTSAERSIGGRLTSIAVPWT
jgi:hypothetical protein